MAVLREGGLLGVAIHHSVYKQAHNLSELKAQATLFNGWHKSKSWAETTKTPSAYPYISYHYLMATDGSILKVTDEKYVKYHAGDNFRGDLSFNLHGIAICLTGNYETDKPTEAMMKSLVAFIRDVEKRYDIDARIRGHKETSKSATACPGKNIGTHDSGWLKQVIANVNDPNYSTEPEKPPEAQELIECQNKVKILESRVTSLESSLSTSQGALKLADERVEFLEQSIAVYESEYRELEAEIDRVKEERDNFEKQLIECIAELNELKKPHWTEQLRDKIVQLWGEYRDKIINFIKGE
jgi:hypothetical protein